MKKIFASLLAFIPIWSSADRVQTIVVDDEHIQMGLPEGEVGRYYAINPAREIAVDASGYVFHHTVGLSSKEPNSIQVIIDKEHQYMVPWRSGQRKYVLSRQTLTPSQKPFEGFAAGDTVVIAIGQLLKRSGDQATFKVQWVGMIHVGAGSH